MKLIRDKLDAVIDPTRLTIVQGDEYDQYLKAKLNEEIQELIDSDYKDESEFADVLEVLRSMIDRFTDADMTDIEIIRIQKRNDRGGFDRGLVLLD